MSRTTTWRRTGRVRRLTQPASSRPIAHQVMWRFGRVGLLGLVGAYASVAPAAAQEAACAEGRIASILIDNQSVFDLSDPGLAGGRFSWAYRVANGLHVRTRESVIARELLFDVGDCYDVELLRDSERLLRGFEFIANAEIFGVRQEDGTIEVVVDTRDEWSTRIEPSVGSNDGIEFEGIELVEDNLLGYGNHVSLFYEVEEEQRAYGAAYSTPQLFATRANLDLRVAETDVGTSYLQSLVYPFVGESGRIAYRQRVERNDRYFEIFRPRNGEELDRIWVPTRREIAEISGAFRWGAARYRHTVVGGALAWERFGYPGSSVYADSVGRPAVPGAIFQPPWEPLSSVRVLGLFGRREVEFVRRRGFDTVNGVEDIQLGYEGEVSVGGTVPGLSDDRGLSSAARLSWAGEPSAALTVGGQLTAEARRDLDAGAWRDVLTELDAWAYFRGRPDARQTVVASVSAVTGWKGSIPFQLTLGGDTGLRGYPRHLDPGGGRVVASLEHRAYLGWPFSDLLDLGSVLFTDVGKIWPGDVPFGIESPVRATAGFGIRAAFPPGSRQTFRADVGFPLRGGEDLRGVVVSVGVGQVIGRRVARRDPQLVRSARFELSGADFVYGY